LTSLFLYNLNSHEKFNVSNTLGANVGAEAPTGEVRGEAREREHIANEQMDSPPPPKPLGFIYRGGGEVHFYLVSLVG
jgi:hypothetical protein